MVRFDIDPTVSVDEIKFGSSRSDVRSKYGEYEEFKKNKYSKNIVINVTLLVLRT